MDETKLRVLINIGTAIATIVFVALIVGLIFQFAHRSVLQTKQDELAKELGRINEQIEYYEGQNNYINNNIEDYARERYGYGKNGENRYTYQ